MVSNVSYIAKSMLSPCPVRSALRSAASVALSSMSELM